MNCVVIRYYAFTVDSSLGGADCDEFRELRYRSYSGIHADSLPNSSLLNETSWTRIYDRKKITPIEISTQEVRQCHVVS